MKSNTGGIFSRLSLTTGKSNGVEDRVVIARRGGRGGQPRAAAAASSSSSSLSDRFKGLQKQSAVTRGVQKRFSAVMQRRTGTAPDVIMGGTVKTTRTSHNGRGGRGGRGGRRGGRGGRGGRGRGGKVSQDHLDKELDSYMLKDPAVAQTRLDQELESYMSGTVGSQSATGDVEMGETTA